MQTYGVLKSWSEIKTEYSLEKKNVLLVASTSSSNSKPMEEDN